MSKLWKYFGAYRQGMLALGLILGVVGIRLFLLIAGWPAVTAEEGTFGLEAMHILSRGEMPVFMYGQDYMGTIEAYTAAMFFHFFGISWFTLRLGMVLLFMLFLICFYLLVRLLYSPKMGLFSLALLGFGSFDMLIPQMRVVGGAVETLLFGTLLLLLAAHLSLRSGQPLSASKQWQRYAGFAAWGICTGLGLWSHLLVAPFVLVSGLLLLWYCRREIRSFAPVALLIGLVIGLLPLLLYNLQAVPGHSSLDAFLKVYISPESKQTHFSLYQLLKQGIGTFFYTIPASTGLNPLYSPYPLPLPTFSPLRTSWWRVIVMGGWSLGYSLLFVLACFMALRGLRHLRKIRSPHLDISAREQHQVAVIYSAQLMLLLSAALTIALFALSSNAATHPWSTRYLVGLQISFPALLWPLWHGASARLARFSFVPRLPLLTLAFRRGLLALLLCCFAAQTFAATAQMSENVADNAQVETLTRDLVQLGITHIYSGYWQCDRFIFQTQEKITCAAVHEDMSPGLTRYQPYASSVRADWRSAYVFPQQSIFETNFEQKTAYLSHGFDRLYLDGYVVYLARNGPIGGMKY